jgi:hypothetical protein
LCIGIGDHQTYIVPHENDGAVDLKMLAQESLKVCGHGALVVASGGRWEWPAPL